MNSEIERLNAENANLQGWKESAMSILRAWDDVGEALGGCRLGESTAEAALREAKRLKASRADLLTELEGLRIVLAKLHDKHCKDNPVPAVLASLALADLAIKKAKGDS